MLVTFHRMRWQDQVTKDAFVSFENSVQVKQTCSNSKVKRTDKTTFPHRLEKGCPSRFQSTTAAVNCPQCICTSCFTSISATEKIIIMLSFFRQETLRTVKRYQMSATDRT